MKRAKPEILLACVLAGCSVQGTPSMTATHATAIQDSVRAALTDFGRYSGAAQWDSVLRLYSTDAGFRWIEQGRRVGIGGVRQALLAMPRGVGAETTYDSTEVVPLAPGVAVLTTYYKTRFVGSSTPVQFTGAISMVWTHEPAGWRIRNGHSSSTPVAPH
jgi:ketosteroid isomerase-like protein